MPQDAFTLRQVVKELGETLVGAKINKVSQPDKDDVYLLVYTKVGAKTLVLSTNAETCRIGYVSEEKPNPKVAPNFCMLLRKHILGATVENISVLGFERIVKIDLAGRNDFSEVSKKTLYLEVMGKYSNAILTENGVILGCLKNPPPDVATTRVTFSGVRYALPKSQDKADITDEEEAKRRAAEYRGGDLADFLFNNFKGLAYPTAAEAAERIGDGKSADEIYAELNEFLLNPPVNPTVAGEGKKKDFYVTDFQAGFYPSKSYSSLLVAQDEYYSEKEKNKAFALKKKALSDKVGALVKKQAKRLAGESEKLLEAENYDALRVKGELITANLYRLEKGLSECSLEDWNDGYKPIIIKLDPRLTPNENAQRYFRKYAKEKRTVEILSPQKEKTERELEYLGGVLFEIENAKEYSDFTDIEEELISAEILPAPKTKGKAREESRYREYEVEGFTVKCGKNNVQNDRLTSRAFKDDLWLHVKGYHSAHVVIETKGEGIPNEVLEKAAEICAFYSDAKGGGKVAVDYAAKKFVKKPPKARPGAVIYTDFKTCLVNPDAHEELRKR